MPIVRRHVVHFCFSGLHFPGKTAKELFKGKGEEISTSLSAEFCILVNQQVTLSGDTWVMMMQLSGIQKKNAVINSVKLSSATNI